MHRNHRNISGVLEVTFITFFCKNQLDKFPDVSFPTAPPNCISDTAKAFLGTVLKIRYRHDKKIHFILITYTVDRLLVSKVVPSC